MIRFVVCIDVEGDDLKEAYRRLGKAMTRACEEDSLEGWETSDEAFDEDGELIPANVLQEAIVSVLGEEDE